MNIAIFSDSYEPQINGVVTQIKNISNCLAKHGHKILVIAPSPDTRHKEYEKNGVKVLLLPSIALPTYPDYRITHISSSRVKRALREFMPDLFHVQTPFSVGWLGLRYAKRFGVPVMGTYHTLISEFTMYLPIPFIMGTDFARRGAWLFTRHFYNRCSLVTTPTESMKNELEKNGVKNVHVLSNAIDFDSFNAARKKNYSSKNIKLIYFGRIGYEKNIEVILFALKHLLWKKKNVCLTITGSGPALDYLKKIAEEQKLARHVSFQGPMDSAELARHIASHDIFVTASTIETQGLTILESMAAGLPCIGADCLAIPDAIMEGKNGFLFRPYDFVECANKIEKLLGSSALRKKLGNNSVKTVQKYSVEGIASQTLALYKTLV